MVKGALCGQKVVERVWVPYILTLCIWDRDLNLIQIQDSLAGLCRIEQSFEEIHLIWIRCVGAGKHLKPAGQRRSRTGVWDPWSKISNWKSLEADQIVLRCCHFVPVDGMWVTVGHPAVAQEDSQSPTNRKVGGSTPGPHVGVFLGKTLNPTLPPSVYEWMCGNE